MAGEEFVGAEVCGACHEKELEQWRATGHASSLARLSTVQQKDASCRRCHTLAPASDAPGLAGVQCEACHGAGRFYSPSFVMKDEELSKLLGLAAVEEAVCLGCHASDGPAVKPFDFATAIERVRHGPSKEGSKSSEVAPNGSEGTSTMSAGPSQVQPAGRPGPARGARG